MSAFPPKRTKGRFAHSNGSQFEYEVEIQPTVGGAAYFAKVRCDGELRGQPNGTLTAPKFTDPMIEDAVRTLVEAAIRDGVAVRIA